MPPVKLLHGKTEFAMEVGKLHCNEYTVHSFVKHLKRLTFLKIDMTVNVANNATKKLATFYNILNDDM